MPVCLWSACAFAAKEHEYKLNLPTLHLNHTNKCYGFWLKALDTFGNCQRPVFSLGVSQHMHQITSLWKFGLNWSLKLQENDERINTLVVVQNSVLSDRNKRLLARSLLLGIKDFWPEVFYYFSEKLLLSQKLGHFRGNCFLQCCILSTALCCSLPSYARSINILSNNQTWTVPLKRTVSLKRTGNDPIQFCDVLIFQWKAGKWHGKNIQEVYISIISNCLASIFGNDHHHLTYHFNVSFKADVGIFFFWSNVNGHISILLKKRTHLKEKKTSLWLHK